MWKSEDYESMPPRFFEPAVGSNLREHLVVLGQFVSFVNELTSYKC